MLHILSSINLWNPSGIIGWGSIAITALLLGMIHGITPDEHTWPITFSYAIGSYSTRRGLRSGITFSLAFTMQRALASELAYLGLARLYTINSLNNFVYIIVGTLMAVAGFMMASRKTIFHFDFPFFKRHETGSSSHQATEEWLKDPKPWMPAVHGFVAGWGFGAFAIIIYTILAPSTHSALWGWVPGAIFGIGTMITQALAGAIFGFYASRRGLPMQAIRRVALKTAANTLSWGGIAFILAGIFSQIFPKLQTFGISTGIHVHNLDSLGIAFILVIVSVVGVGLTTIITQTQYELHRLKPVRVKA